MTFGLLICPGTHTVHDVSADQWTILNVRHLLGVEEGIVRHEIERSGDWIYVSALLNASAEGRDVRCEGFDLFGDRYYGPALLVAGRENGIAPVLDPHDISRAIHFFRLDQYALV